MTNEKAKREKRNNSVKAGQYYAAAYNGDNGDLILGCVKSVRRNGEVILENLISGKNSTKSIEVLLRRNKRITKAQADQVLEVYRKSGRPAARKFAVSLASYTNGLSEADLLGSIMQRTYIRMRENTTSAEPKQDMEALRKELGNLLRTELRTVAEDRTILEAADIHCMPRAKLIDWIVGDVPSNEVIRVLREQNYRRVQDLIHYKTDNFALREGMAHLKEQMKKSLAYLESLTGTKDASDSPMDILASMYGVLDD